MLYVAGGICRAVTTQDEGYFLNERRNEMKQSKKIIEILRKTYPDAKCSLDFETPFEMVVAVMLSAQCTDERVNKTTPSIFSKYKTPKDFAKIDLEELEVLIHPCGFYKNKAKNIKACAEMILDKFNRRGAKEYGRPYESPRGWKKECKCCYARSFWRS